MARYRGFLGHAGAVAFLAGCAALLSYPLIAHVGTQIPGAGAGDNVSFVWNVWWFRGPASALRPFDCPLLCAPFGVSLVLATHTALPALVGATLFAGLEVVAATNVLVLAGLTLNGVMAYALAFRQVGARLPAVLAGVVFGGSAYVFIHLLGHYNLVQAWTLPLFALAWLELVERPRPRAALLAGLALAVTMYVDYYYVVFAVAFAAVWWIAKRYQVTWKVARRKSPGRAIVGLLVALLAVDVALAAVVVVTGGTELALGGVSVSLQSLRNLQTGLWVILAAGALVRWRLSVAVARTDSAAGGFAFGRLVALAAATCLLLTLPIAQAAWRLVMAGDYVSESHRWLSGPRGVDLATFFLGHPLHPLYGSFVRRAYDGLGIGVMEQAAWLGVVPLVLLAATAWSRRAALLRDPWLLIGLLSLVWALGPFLTIGHLESGVILPQAILRYVPLVSNARIPGRAIVMVQLSAAMLCAVVAARLHLKPWKVAGLVTITLLDSLPLPFPLYDMPRGGQVEAYLRSPAAEDGAVLELPTGILDGFGHVGRWDQRVLAWQMAHGRPVVGGSGGRIPERIKLAYRADPVFSRVFDLSAGLTDAGTYPPLPADPTRHLLDLGIRYIALNRDVAPPLLVEFAQATFRLRQAAVDGPRELYELK